MALRATFSKSVTFEQSGRLWVPAVHTYYIVILFLPFLQIANHVPDPEESVGVIP